MSQPPENQQQYGSILTILGENAEQNGKLKNKQITFTHIAIGDANDQYVQPDRKQTALVNELARIPVNSVDVLQPTPDSTPMLKVEAILPDDVNDLIIREFAAVATFDGNTYFHAVGNCARIYVPAPVNNGNVSTPVTLEMIFVITSAEPIVEIDPNVVTASREYVVEKSGDAVQQAMFRKIFPPKVDRSLLIGNTIPSSITALRLKQNSGDVGIFTVWDGLFHEGVYKVHDIQNLNDDVFIISTDKGEFEALTEQAVNWRKKGDIRGWGGSGNYYQAKVSLLSEFMRGSLQADYRYALTAAEAELTISFDKTGNIVNPHYTDNTQPAIRCLADSGVLYTPAGYYAISDRVYEQTNGGRRKIRGDGKYQSRFVAVPAMQNNTLFHLGNNNGHGAYQAEITDVSIDAGEGQGNIAVVLHEAGLSRVAETYVLNSYIAYRLAGSTDVEFEGKNFIFGGEFGIVGKCIFQGIPVDQWDLDTSKGPFSPCNKVDVKHVWFSGVNQPVYIEGDQCVLEDNVAQSCGTDGTKHLFEINNLSYIGASFGGCRVANNWSEGGKHKYMIAVIGARNSLVDHNYIIGDGSISTNGKEGGVLVDRSPGTKTHNNIGFQFFTRPPQNGREANALIYVRQSKNTGDNWEVEGNVLYRNQAGNQYYFEGLPGPTLSKSSRNNIFGVVDLSNPDNPVIKNGKNILEVVKVVPGEYQVVFQYNRESEDTMVQITPIHNAPVMFGYENNGVGYIRIMFADGNGPVTPKGFSISSNAEQNQN